MLSSTTDHYPCRMISPSVVLDHRLDGVDLAWVRDHLRRCEACRYRVETFREELVREGRLATGLEIMPAPASVRRRASAHRERVAQSRRYAVVALMAALVAAFFASSSPRFTANAVRPSPRAAGLVDTGSLNAALPSIAPTASAVPQASASPAPAPSAPAAVARPSHSAPTARPASSATPVADEPPAVILIVSPRSGLAPLTVTADASRSADTDGMIASYKFDFGDGSSPVWGTASTTHIYCRAGTYTVTVTVTDSTGLRSSAYLSVDVTAPTNQFSC